MSTEGANTMLAEVGGGHNEAQGDVIGLLCQIIYLTGIIVH